MDLLYEAIILLVPYTILMSLIYVLYLIVINKFEETKRSFFSDTLIEFSSEGREWAKMYLESMSNAVETPKKEEEVKPTPSAKRNNNMEDVVYSIFSTLMFSPVFTNTILPTIYNIISSFGQTKPNIDTIFKTITNHIVNSDHRYESLSELLLSINEELRSMKVKQEVPNEPPNGPPKEQAAPAQ